MHFLNIPLVKSSYFDAIYKLLPRSYIDHTSRLRLRMAELVSSWSKGVQFVPKDYVFPPESRPVDITTVCKEIPVINLQNDRSEIVQQILKACQEFGLFQVINHGIPDKMMADIMVLSDEFFSMLVEDKLDVYSEKYGKGCVLFTGVSYQAKEDTRYWKDTLKHLCHPLEEHTPSWPAKPARYRKDVGKYVVEMRKLGFKILDLITDGLGLKEGYFNNQMCEDQAMAINYYSPCPDPSVAMGLGAHADPNVLTILQQNHFGLQLEKDGKWLGVESIQNAFVVNVGCILEVISNGKLKSAVHRGVLNSTVSRTSIATFFGPNHYLPIVIEPAKELVTTSCPPMFKSYQYNDFIADYFGGTRTSGSSHGMLLDPYRI